LRQKEDLNPARCGCYSTAVGWTKVPSFGTGRHRGPRRDARCGSLSDDNERKGKDSVVGRVRVERIGREIRVNDICGSRPSTKCGWFATKLWLVEPSEKTDI
jgi:hypothetical protein